MLVLVTGASGFVGSHLVRRLLREGDRVRCLVRGSRPRGTLSGLPVDVVEGDVCRPETLGLPLVGVEEVYHLAGRIAAVTPREMHATNVGGTVNLLKAIERTAPPVRRFVLCSTQSVVGPSNGGPPVTEASPYRPMNCYAESKAAAERAVIAAGRRGLAYTLVRPPMVFGPRDTALLPFFALAARGLQVHVGPAPKAYSWVYAPDLADAMVRLARSGAAAGKAYFTGHPLPATMDEILDEIAVASGRRGIRWSMPHALLGCLARASALVSQVTGNPGALPSDRLADLTARAWLCRSDAAERDAGWRASTPLPQAIAETVRWYEAHGWFRLLAPPPLDTVG